MVLYLFSLNIALRNRVSSYAPQYMYTVSVAVAERDVHMKHGYKGRARCHMGDIKRREIKQ